MARKLVVRSVHKAETIHIEPGLTLASASLLDWECVNAWVVAY